MRFVRWWAFWQILDGKSNVSWLSFHADDFTWIHILPKRFFRVIGSESDSLIQRYPNYQMKISKSFLSWPMPRLVVTMANSRFNNEILVTCFHPMQVVYFLYSWIKKCFSIFLFGILPCSFLLIEADGFSFGPRHGLRARLYETFVIFSLLFLLILFFFCLIVSTFWFWKIFENFGKFEIFWNWDISGS